MKKLEVTFKNTRDTTGYLFSLTKCLSAALSYGGYAEYAQDIIASSGFAFRMWAASDLCPSAMSIWEFQKQKPWVENGGLCCDYVERMWGQDEIEEERRLKGIEIIKESIDNGIAAVAWDISGCEWGLVTGYNDDTQTLYTLKIDGNDAEVSYSELGKLELPILSVLTVTGKTDKSPERIVRDTKKLALSHLRGKEWCDNAKGLEAYDSLITFVNEKLTVDILWNLEYYLGTYAALKWYAWQFFDKYGETELSEIYQKVYDCWQSAFDTLKEQGEHILNAESYKVISDALSKAKSLEEKAMGFFEKAE